MHQCIAVVTVLLALSTLSLADDCNVLVGGNLYDLSDLDESPSLGFGKYQAKVSACSPVAMCGGYMCFSDNQTPNGGLPYDGGATREVTQLTGQGTPAIQLLFANGSSCPDVAGGSYSTTLMVLCRDDYEAPSWKFASYSNCRFNIVVRTNEVCAPGGVPKKLSGGWIFIIICICCVLFYCIAGVLYNTIIKGGDGRRKSVMPNADSWRLLWELVNDGLIFTGDMIRRYIFCQRPGEEGHNPAFKQIKNENL